MRRVVMIVTVLNLVAGALIPMPAAAEVEKAVIAVLGGMQCSL